MAKEKLADILDLLVKKYYAHYFCIDNYNYSSIQNGIINDTDFKFRGMFSQSPFIDRYIGFVLIATAL